MPVEIGSRQHTILSSPVAGVQSVSAYGGYVYMAATLTVFDLSEFHMMGNPCASGDQPIGEAHAVYSSPQRWICDADVSR